MTVVCKQILEKFIKKHAQAGTSLRPWLAEAERANWKTTQDIRNRFNSADFLWGTGWSSTLEEITSGWWSSPSIQQEFSKSTGSEPTQNTTNGISNNSLLPQTTSNAMKNPIKIIKTSEENEAALDRLGELMLKNPLPDSDEANELELLALLIKTYEDKNVEIGLPTPLEAIQFRMEQSGLKQKDLIPYIGTKSRVSEVLAGKRPLTLAMARELHNGLGIPAEILLASSDELLNSA